jgi:hypothetical protein
MLLWCRMEGRGSERSVVIACTDANAGGAAILLTVGTDNAGGAIPTGLHAVSVLGAWGAEALVEAVAGLARRRGATPRSPCDCRALDQITGTEILARQARALVMSLAALLALLPLANARAALVVAPAEAAHVDATELVERDLLPVLVPLALLAPFPGVSATGKLRQSRKDGESEGGVAKSASRQQSSQVSDDPSEGRCVHRKAPVQAIRN